MLIPKFPNSRRLALAKNALTPLDSHPEIRKARAEVEKAEAAIRLAKTDIWVPDVEIFARYSHQDNVPFLANNFGTFGIHFGYDLFDGGRKRAVLRGAPIAVASSEREPREADG